MRKKTTATAKRKRKFLPYKFVANKTWKLRRMPRDLKEKLDSMMSRGEVKTSLQLKNWLARNGFEISRRCIDDYRRKFENSLDAVRLATEQARLVCRQFKHDDEKMQGALTRLVQTRVFEVLVAANRRGTSKNNVVGSPITPVNITALARCVSGLARAETEHRKWAERARENIAAVEKKVDAARAKGLSKDAADQIKAALLDFSAPIEERALSTTSVDTPCERSTP